MAYRLLDEIKILVAVNEGGNAFKVPHSGLRDEMRRDGWNYRQHRWPNQRLRSVVLGRKVGQRRRMVEARMCGASSHKCERVEFERARSVT